MNFPCLLVEIICGWAGGNLACTRFEKCRMGFLADSFLGVLGGWLGGQVFLQLFASDFSPSEMELFLSCVGGGVLGGALLAGIVGRIRTRLRRGRRS